ncbi:MULTISPECIES: restriction endonuclease subunit S [Acinetobacter]|uniref:restriction endonuclease subunit S n=1 Tax=Acinetobacter TaxID=469 RepID=UPI00141B7106|nr:MULTISPECIES: restriction endonuclease subunit S [Acinetobacter]MCS4298362.1 type I restriction enzyme S subunit [Acinetobacter guillouiae]MCW2251966.1 type I restriction enzyme S subunit [Acinetobacter sp. BIGb0204]NII38619.1 type I restriction enzyme S subunit [Acinetobacter sp. BIGb0196]
MTDVKKLITEHLDIWLTAETEKKSGRGRSSGSSNSIYGVQKLRELILDLAIRGKLIPQHDSDQDAHNLVKYSIKLNHEAITKGVLKKSKKLPIADYDFKFSDIPRQWALTSIPYILKNHEYAIKRGPFGSAIQKSFFVDDGYKIYEQQHAINDNFYLGNYYISEEKFKELKAFEVQAEDIIISCSGTVGKVAIAPHDLEKGIINQALLKISLNQEIMLNEYFKILFPSYFMKIDKFSNLKGTAQKNMPSVEEIKSTPFLLPPLEEQKRIVAKVDELMQLCDQLEEQQSLSSEAHDQLVDTLLNVLTNSSNADEFQENWQRISENFDLLFTTEYSMGLLKQKILQLAVMGKLVKQDLKDEPASELLKHIVEKKARLVKDGVIKKPKFLPEKNLYENTFTSLPDNWILTNLASLAEINPRNNMIDDSIFVSFVPMTLIHREYLNKHEAETKTWAEVKKGFTHFANNDIGVAKITPCFENSKACVFQNLTNDVGAGTTELHIVRPIVGLDSEYVLIYLKSPVFLKTGEAHMTGTAGQKRLPKEFVEYFNFPLPPLNEQKRIVEKVNQLFSMIDTLQTLQGKLQRTKLHLSDSLVANALSDSDEKSESKASDSIIQFEKKIEAAKQSNQKSADQIDLFVDESVEDDVKLLSLAAEITFQLHTEPTFGHLKLQKLIYLCQQLKRMNLVADFKQHAAGPYDPVMARYLDKEFKDRDWFSYDPKRDLKYKPLSRCNDHRSAFNKYFAKDVSEIYDLIGLFRTSKSDHIEIVATLFACWLRLLEKKLFVTEEQLLKDFYAWSEEKKEFSQNEVLNGLKWMKQNSVVPL